MRLPLVLALTVGLAATAAGQSTAPASLADAPAILVGSETAETGLLLVHDWFGVTEFTRSTAARFADRGFRVATVDLYGGHSATTHDSAGKLMARLGERDPAAVQSELDAAVASLSRDGRRVIVVGFSAGGAWAMKTALANPETVLTTVILYGGGMEAESDSQLARLERPVLLVTGSKDTWALDTALDLVPRLDAVAHGAEVFIYPGARHAYAQPLFAEGANYDEVATEASWRVVDDFLARLLKVQ